MGHGIRLDLNKCLGETGRNSPLAALSVSLTESAIGRLRFAVGFWLPNALAPFSGGGGVTF